MTGLGAQAGVLALGVAGLGLLGRFVADSLEDLPRGPQIAVTAAGGSRLQMIGAATLPMAVPATVGHVLYLLDHNLRSATLLGIVGGGGVGFYLNDASRIGDYHVVSAILLMVLATVLVVEGISTMLRWALR
jgi:phosphonate transport system permease protein